jgi:DNA-binding PadR family transcriptional regulator
MARRRPGSLVALELEILEVALSLHEAGEGTFHGFGLARHLRERNRARSLTAHGTLYKALGRLEEFGLLRSTWDAEGIDGRPRRRLYELTPDGALVAGRARAAVPGQAADRGRDRGAQGADVPAPRVAREPA